MVRGRRSYWVRRQARVKPGLAFEGVICAVKTTVIILAVEEKGIKTPKLLFTSAHRFYS